MNKENSGASKGKIAAAAAIVGAALAALTCLFLGTVREQLWQQSIRTILESTQQGCLTLRVQLEDEYRMLGRVAGYLNEAGRVENVDSLLRDYVQVDEGVVLYSGDGGRLPYGAQADEAVARILAEDSRDYGILEPHISSATGVNVFNLFIRLTMADGTAAYLVKEYEVDSIVDSFSISFYQNAGFSYVVDSDGNVLIRPPHPNSNKTVQNLFDILEESPNDPSKMQLFVDSLSTEKTGWATFSYQGEGQRSDQPDHSAHPDSDRSDYRGDRRAGGALFPLCQPGGREAAQAGGLHRTSVQRGAGGDRPFDRGTPLPAAGAEPGRIAFVKRTR